MENIMTDKFMQEFNDYNKLMKRLGSKTKTLAQYEAYRSGKLRRSRGKGHPKPAMEATTYRRETPKYPSGDTYDSFAAPKREMKYTGDRLLGIATMHKSNMVPVFSQESAEEISKMRRN
jgi:hypothetical protein